MRARKDRIGSLANRLGAEIEAGRQEGMTDVEIGAALGLILAKLAPDPAERAHIVAFAERAGARYQ